MKTAYPKANWRMLCWIIVGAIGVGTWAGSVEPSEFKPAIDSPVGRRVFADLGAYYESLADEKRERKLVPYEKMVQRLASPEPAESKEAGEYLLALCIQSAQDDQSGRAPTPRGMKLGGGPNEHGAELRGWLASELSTAKFHDNGANAMAAVHWIYKNDVWPEHRKDASSALARIRTPEADKLLVEIIHSAEGHFEILTSALSQAAARKLSSASEAIRPLCRHYKPAIRQAALAAAAALGLKDVAAYDPRTDLGPRLESWLKNLLLALPEKVPVTAQWRRFTQPDHTQKGEAKEVEASGWLLGEVGDDYRIIDGRGHPVQWNRKETRVHDDSLRALAERMAKFREKYNATKDTDEKWKLQEQMGIHSFMMRGDDTWDGSVPEVLAAAWSLERSDRETCARLLLPLLEGVNDEQLFLNHFRDDIATDIDIRMLGAFTSREFAEALRLAKFLAMPFFEGFPHQDRAKGLAATLPQRLDDFKTLKLVTPETWKMLQRQYSRERQVGFLAQRLRLIHATQFSIPGGISASATQYLPEDDAAKPKDQLPWLSTGVEAINPYSELLRLNLTGNDLLQLVPYLDSPDYILAFDLYRFTPNSPRTLHKVSSLAGAICNQVSQGDLVDTSVLESKSRESRQQHLEQIRKWCREHAKATHADNLAKTIHEAEDWQDVRIAFWNLLEFDESQALKLIVPRCERDPEHVSELAQLVCLLDRKEFLARAREWMQAKDEWTRFWGALLVLKHADRKKPEGLEIVLAHLTAVIEKKLPGDSAYIDGDSLLDGAVEALLAIDDARVRTFFTTYCGPKPHDAFDPSTETLQRLFLAGYESAYERLLVHLADNTPESDSSQKPRSDAWLWWLSLWRDKEPREELFDVPDDKRAELSVGLKQWLADQFKLIKAGKPTAVIKDELRLPWGDWKMYSSGWVRRL